MKDSLSSFLPNLPGVVDTPGSQDNSSLRGLIEKPPGKPLNFAARISFEFFHVMFEDSVIVKLFEWFLLQWLVKNSIN